MNLEGQAKGGHGEETFSAHSRTEDPKLITNSNKEKRDQKEGNHRGNRFVKVETKREARSRSWIFTTVIISTDLWQERRVHVRKEQKPHNAARADSNSTIAQFTSWLHASFDSTASVYR